MPNQVKYIGTVKIDFRDPKTHEGGSVNIQYTKDDSIRNIIERVINNFTENHQNPDDYSLLDGSGHINNINRGVNGVLRNGETYILHKLNEGGMMKEYIKLQKGGKRLIRYGSKGGKYYMKGGNKVYIK